MLTDPLHPSLVHIPLGLAMVVPVVAAGLALAIWRGFLPRRSWLVAAGLQILLVAGGAGAFLAGERDEKRVDGFVADRLVALHEERAVAFLWAGSAVLAVALGVLVVGERRAPALAALATAGSLAVAGLGLWTGKAGGELVYRHGAAKAFAGRAIGAAEAGRAEETGSSRRH